MRRSSRALVVAVLSVSAGVGACMNPELEARQWEEIQNVSSEVVGLRDYTGALEDMVDSLRRVIARQDTAIRLLVDFTGAHVPGFREGDR